MIFSAPIVPFMPFSDKAFLLDSEDGLSFDEVCPNAELFSSGRDALLRAIKLALSNRDDSSSKVRKIFLPKYFCPWVIKSVLTQYCVQVEFFDDFPTHDTPDFSTLNVTDGDIVIAVNYFGVRDFSIWEDWKKSNNKVILIADFSHTPFSNRDKITSADFIFASLRKTLPLCDGGYLLGKFTPNKMYLKSGEGCDFSSTYAYSAALAQIDYQSAQDFYYNAEMRLNAKCNISRMSFYSYNALKHLDLLKLWKKRNSVFYALKSNLLPNERFYLLENPILSSDIFSIFCPTFVFENVSLRDKAYAELAKTGVLPSIYWGSKFLKDKLAKRESSKLMTVSLDFRHTKSDAEKIAQILNNVFK